MRTTPGSGTIQPSPSPSLFDPGPADPLSWVVGALTIALAIAAGILGYRILRGGREL